MLRFFLHLSAEETATVIGARYQRLSPGLPLPLNTPAVVGAQPAPKAAVSDVKQKVSRTMYGTMPDTRRIGVSLRAFQSLRLLTFR